ncbi:MAG: NADH-quinone oxidoreductase subunit C [Jiangellales bacterium]
MSEENTQLEESTPQPLPAHPSDRGAFGAHGSGDTSGFGGLVRRVANPANLIAGTPAPYGSYFDGIVDTVNAANDDAIEKVVVDRDELTVFVRREKLLDVVRTLRDEPTLRFEMCMGVNGVHYPDETDRELHAVYPFLSVTHNRRVRIEVTAPDTDPHVPSIVSVYPSNNWHERETWDFFGLIFDGHPALTRIEMPDDWDGHPQRKDYPLGGIEVEYKGATIPPPDERRKYS